MQIHAENDKKIQQIASAKNVQTIHYLMHIIPYICIDLYKIKE